MTISMDTQIATTSVYVYTVLRPADGYYDLFLQRYDFDGTKIGDPIQVNTSTALDYQVSYKAAPFLLSDGGLLISFDAVDPTSGFYSENLYLQQLSAAGTKVGSEIFLANDFQNVNTTQAVAVPGGGYAYLLSSRYQGDESSTTTVSLYFGTHDGLVLSKTLSTFTVEFTVGGPPEPVLIETDPVLTLLPEGTVNVTFRDYYITGEPGEKTYNETYNAEGQLIALSIFDTINDTRESLTPIVGKPYAYQDTVTNEGHIVSLTREYADGSPQLQVTVALDGTQTAAHYAPDGSREVDKFAANGQLTTVTNYNAQNRETSFVQRSADGTNFFETLDPMTGTLVKSGTYKSGGPRSEVDYAITGKPYTEQSASYDAAGKLLSMERGYANGTVAFTQVNNADGSGKVANYDIQGRLTTTIAFASNGSHDVTLRTYADSTNTTPASTEVDHYSVDNQKTSSDTLLVNGAHTQVAFTAGVALTSFTGVTDTLVASSAGGDTFVFHAAFGQDLITNFQSGAAPNKIQFDSAVVPDFTHLQYDISQSDAGAIIRINQTDNILLKGVTATALHSSDFSFVAHNV